MNEDNDIINDIINYEENDDDDALILTDEIELEKDDIVNDNIIEKEPEEKITQRARFYSNTDKNEEKEGTAISVVGAGTIGGLISGLFMRHGNKVSCFSSPSASKRVIAEGISINSKIYGDFSFRPEISYLVKQKPEIIIVAPRATHIDIAMTAIHKKRVENSIIIPITSGFEYLKNLQNDYGYSVSAGFIEPVFAYRKDVNRIVHEEGKIKLTVANDKTIERDRLEKLSDTFKIVGIDFKVMNSVTDLIWLKMISFCAISLISAISREPFKKAIKNKLWADSMERIIGEALFVAKKEGSKITYDDIMKIIGDIPSGYKPPLLLDLEKGQIGEIDDIASSISRLGIKHELSCPEINKIVSQIIDKAPKYYEVKVSSYL